MPRIRLGDIACARSGDKGSGANVGVIARTAAGFDLLRRELTPEAVERYFRPLGVGRVVRYELPNLLALNFILPDVLDGGGSLTLRTDAQGKTLGQAILEMSLEAPESDVGLLTPSPGTPGEGPGEGLSFPDGAEGTGGKRPTPDAPLRTPGERRDEDPHPALSRSTGRGEEGNNTPAAQDLVHVESSSPQVALVTLNRPDKRNALSVALIERLTDTIHRLPAEPGRRVLILRGAGPAFCAGLDLNEASDPAAAGRSAESLARLYLAIRRSPLVTVAAAHGAAFGGGAGLLAACDFVVAADDLRIGFPEVRRGLVAALVTCLLRRQVAERSLRELILLGETVPAPRAMALGLVNRVVPAADLAGASLDLAREVCRGAPGAGARTKSLLDDLSPRPIEQDVEVALKYHLAARHAAEAAEGIAAFREKREPRWD